MKVYSMIKTTYVSIIIPTYNRAHIIGETIKSIINQTYPKWELIIVDDGSSDNTESIIKQFGDSRIIYQQRPANRERGGNAARNWGFEVSKGKYVKWLDSDDLLAPHCLEKQMSFIKENNLDVVFSRSRFFKEISSDGHFTWDKYWSKFFPLKDPFDNYLFGKIRFSTGDGLWKKQFIGPSPFQEDLRNSQEWLMLVQQLSKKPNYHIDDEVLVYSRMHSEQMHNQKSFSFHYKHQILARYYAIKSLKKQGNLSGRRFKYLFKNMIFNFTRPVKKGEFKYFLSNTLILVKTCYHGVHILFK
ncbi:glycosyltransferase family 2 protein [Christiangramia sabulilitoris]|uniref:Glycosyltransferase family 2 protein n=1 Tax=Christiangramia sabulilitoris TaxID=2583991 RepID=A0A550I2B3_9FLAO|nr:glycosyltransferase family 2 protein [Christiangramia sabulilitoris]TRO65112.1 glycosyltransferase family 2 protein [Christiangramia sabulilitoris]